MPDSPQASSPLQVLQQVFGYPAFRGQQQAIIERVSKGHDALVLMPTGGGKSLCYQVPAILRQRAGQGVTIVVSPLIALMHDQVGALIEAGVSAAYLNSSLSQERASEIERQHLGPHMRRVLERPAVQRVFATEQLALTDI